MRVWIYILGFLLTFSAVHGQDEETIHVITKRISKTFPYAKGFEVNLEGNNAEVFVETWEEQKIGIEIELISKHPDEAIAMQDLERMKYLAERVKRKIYLRNYPSSDETTPVQAVLAAKYVIKVPESCPVYLKNQFGETNVKDLANQLRIFSEFSPINLENVSGTVDMRSKFGDITGRKLNGNFEIFARRSNVNLHEIVGNYNVTAQYSLVNLYAGQGLIDLNIDATKTDVNLFNIDPQTHQHNLLVNNGNLFVPEEFQLSFLENTPQIRKVVFKPENEYYANITISVTFGDLKVEKKR